MQKNYKGFYINLDSSIDRRIFIEHQLRDAGVLQHYTRFKAIINTELYPSSHLKESELGCLKSHISLLKENQGTDKHIHIIEDDIKFSNLHHDTIEKFMDMSDDWDILFTGLQIPLIRQQIDALIQVYETKYNENEQGIAFFDMQNFLFVGAFSYIVNKNSIDKIIDIYDKQNFNEPIDFIFRKEICINKTLRAKCIFPLMAMHSGELETTMKDRAFELTYKYQYLFQKPLIANANLDKVFKEIKDYGLSIGHETKIQDCTLKHIYDELFSLGKYITSSTNIHGKYREQH